MKNALHEFAFIALTPASDGYTEATVYTTRTDGLPCYFRLQAKIEKGFERQFELEIKGLVSDLNRLLESKYSLKDYNANGRKPITLDEMDSVIQ